MSQTKTPSDRVIRLLGAGWSSACDGLVALAWSRQRRRPSEDEYRLLDLYAGERHVQMCISPAGRSVRIFVDGEEAAGR